MFFLKYNSLYKEALSWHFVKTAAISSAWENAFALTVARRSQHLCNIRVDHDALRRDLVGHECRPEAYACERDIRTRCGHAPERVLDDAGRIHPDAELEEERPLPLRMREEVRVARSRSIPARILVKARILDESARRRRDSTG